MNILKIVNNGTSSLLIHVKNKHPIEFERKLRGTEIQAEGGATASPVPASSPSTVVTSGLPTFKFQQPTLATTIEKTKKFPNDSPRKQAIDEVILRMVYTDLQPFSVVEDEG